MIYVYHRSLMQFCNSWKKKHISVFKQNKLFLLKKYIFVTNWNFFCIVTFLLLLSTIFLIDVVCLDSKGFTVFFCSSSE